VCTGVGNASHYTLLIGFGFPTVYIDGNGNWNGRDWTGNVIVGKLEMGMWYCHGNGNGWEWEFMGMRGI